MRLNFQKTLQASAEFLRREPGKQMSRLRLLKLLYIADRESLRRTGRPITYDHVVAMKHGPVLSRLYDIIKGEDVLSPEFAKYVSQTGHQLSLVEEPGKSNLNRFEIRLLHELAEDYSELGDWEIVEETHTFKEWIKNNPGESSQPIPLEDVLEALGFDVDRIESVIRDTKAVQSLQRLFPQS